MKMLLIFLGFLLRTGIIDDLLGYLDGNHAVEDETEQAKGPS